MGRFHWWLALAGAVCLLALAQRVRPASCLVVEEEDFDAWLEFKRQFNKSYERPDEEQRRLEIFLDNKRYIESQNLKGGPLTFEQGVNQLSDLTTDEIIESRCGFRLRGPLPARGTGQNVLESILNAFNVSRWAPDDTQSPEGDEENKETRAWYESLLTEEELDYRRQGIVSRVKDQGACGSCWAFATTGALESRLAQQGRQFLLSEQDLIDCSGRYGNHGCSGGLMNAALRYVRDRGIMLARDYPYTGKEGRCRHRPDQVVTRCRTPMTLPRGNEAMLRVALALSGPLPVAIDAGPRSFHSYKSGVYNDPDCRNSPRSLNHAVLLVGYGTTKTGGDFWLLKNSWGRSWGDNGYIKMARNLNNQCGVASFAVLPIM